VTQRRGIPALRRANAPVSCAGRWGRRRARVTECWAVLRAEDCYTAMLRDNAPRVKPGAKGSVQWSFPGRSLEASWEIRPNAVWRRGRIFLLCRSCARLCTRLYLPLEDSSLACRRCWGLTYSSQTLANYKESLYGREVWARRWATSQRQWALLATREKRKERLTRCRERWATRVRCLGKPADARTT
jgi:hypothetical protein